MHRPCTGGLSSQQPILSLLTSHCCLLHSQGPNHGQVLEAAQRGTWGIASWQRNAARAYESSPGFRVCVQGRAVRIHVTQTCLVFP